MKITVEEEEKKVFKERKKKCFWKETIKIRNSEFVLVKLKLFYICNFDNVCTEKKKDRKRKKKASRKGGKRRNYGIGRCSAGGGS